MSRELEQNRAMSRSTRITPELDALVHLFYASLDELGQFEEVSSEGMEEPFQKLLDHDEHMTVTVEEHHQCAVDVVVLETRWTTSHYSRKILLTRQTDQSVVQFGIVRLNLDFLGPDVRAEIESQQTPLGRILIEHNVLRKVRLLSLWKVTPRQELAQLLGLNVGDTCYGRTALIYCNGVPAVELLEIVTP